MSLTATPNPVVAGNTLEYRAVLTNAGPGAAANAQMLLIVEPGEAFQAVKSSAGTCKTPAVRANGPVLCSFGPVSATPGQNTRTVLLKVEVLTLHGTTEGAAKVHTASTDPNTANNATTVLTPVTPRVADLSLQMGAPSQVAVGGQITYTLTAHNAGPNSNYLTSISDPVPVGTTFLSATASQGRCHTPSVGARGMVHCALGALGIKPTNNAATVVVTVQEVATGGLIENRAAVASAHAQDPTPLDNVASATTTLVDGIVLPSPGTTDIGVALSALGGLAQTSKNLSYIVSVANGGPDAASDVQVQDAVPAGATFVSASPSQGSCTTPAVGATGTVACDLGELVNDGTGSVVLTVHVTAGPGALLVDTATAQSGVNDFVPNAADTTQTISTLVNDPTTIVYGSLTAADVSIDLKTNNTPSAPTHVMQTVTLVNHGPNKVTDVAFTIDLSQGVSPVLADLVHTQGSCTEHAADTDTLITCDSGPVLANGTPVVFVLPTIVNQTQLLKDPKNLTGVQLYGSNPDWLIGNNPLLTHAILTMPLFLAEATATITGETGVAFDNNENDKFSAVVSTKPFKPPEIIVLQQNHTCKNKDFGMFGALLQIDCNSPINKVLNAGTQLAALAASALGQTTIGLVIFYTIDTIAYIAEDTAWVTTGF